MKKIILHFWLDLSMFLAFAGMALTGSVLKWGLPPRYGGGAGWRGGWGAAEGPEEEGVRWFLGLHRSQWLDIHFLLSVLIAGLVLVHLVLHWKWIVSAVKSHRPGHPAGAPSQRALEEKAGRDPLKAGADPAREE